MFIRTEQWGSTGTSKDDLERSGEMQMNLRNDEKWGITKVDEGRRGSIGMNADETGEMMNNDEFYGIPRIGWNDQGGRGSI